MLGDKYEIKKEDQVRLVRVMEWWIPNKRIDVIAKYARAQSPSRKEMTKIGAVRDYFEQAIRAAIAEAEFKP